MSSYVYILKCSDGSCYVGSSNNLKDRIRYHTSGLVRTTKSRLPVKLAWYCCFNSKAKALQFEKYLKQGSGFAFSRQFSATTKLLVTYEQPRRAGSTNVSVNK